MSSPISHQDLAAARWFAGKHRRIAGVRAEERFGARDQGLTIAEVAYADGDGPERYLLPDAALRWGPLLEALLDGPLDGDAGRIELRPAPALSALLDPGAP